MDNEEKMKLYKLRILRSFRWQKDIIIPLSKELGISSEEFEDILMNHLDMSSLNSLHSTYESSIPEVIMNKLEVDLKLFWYVDILELISKEEASDLKVQLSIKILDGYDYNQALEEGKQLILEMIR